MKGGHNRKTAKQHLEDGTYRPDRHGYISPSDEESLTEMKDALYTSFKEITKEMAKFTKSSDEYKNLNAIRSDQMKVFYSITKAPIEEKPKINDNPDGFK